MSAAKKKQPSREIPLPVRCALWGQAGGRCEFGTCNTLLYRHPDTKEFVNVSEAAHIIGFSEEGPRGEKDLSEELAKDVANLMLLCRICHKTIDTNRERYPVTLLRQMKTDHEHRIEIQTGIHKDKSSHVLLYGANIGHLSRHLSFSEVAPALPPNWWPADTTPIARVDTGNTFRDKTPEFWSTEARQLENWLNQQVHPRIASGDVKHLSVFALAPQPLLILLGALLTDIPAAQVYQLHREPPDWQWQKDDGDFRPTVDEPEGSGRTPVLVLSLSATVTSDRIHRVVGEDVTIWRLATQNPHNDCVQSPDHLQAFRRAVRRLMDRIKAVHGQDSLLHVFPAAAPSLCVEFGRVRMPKADMPLCIYDQNNNLGGFVETLRIGGDSC